MGRIRIRLECLPPQPPAELGLTDAAVAEHNHLQIPQRRPAGREVGQMCPQSGQAIVVFILGQDLGRDVAELRLGLDDESFQTRQFDDCLGEISDPGLPAVEFPQRGAFGQRRQIGDLGV